MSQWTSNFLHLLYSRLLVTIPLPTYDFTDQVVIITGSNRGVGLEVARHCHRLNAARVILAVRDVIKGAEAAVNIAQSNPTKPPDRVSVWQLDLSSPDSILAFSERAGKELYRLDVVVSNASVHPSKWSSVNGYESNIAINVMGPTLLCLILLPLMTASSLQISACSRFTFVGDDVFYQASFNERWQDEDYFSVLNHKSLVDWSDRYATSKLFLLYACREIARRHPFSLRSRVVISYTTTGRCVDIHSIRRGEHATFTRKLEDLFARSTEVGSRIIIHAVSPETSPSEHGKVLANCQVTSAGSQIESAAGFESQFECFKQLILQLYHWCPDLENSSQLKH